MKNPLLPILLFMLLGSCQEKEIQEASGTIKALCYNVAGLPNIISSSVPVRNTSLVSPLINEFDIVHVQEDFCYHDSLLLYNEHPFVTPNTPCIGDGLNTFSNYPILHFKRSKWNDCTGADCSSDKGFSFSKIEIEKGVTIDFYNLHCNAGGSAASIDARRGNLYQLLEHINTYSVGEPIVLMGDFNHKYTRLGDSTRVLLSEGFRDPWLDLITNKQIPDYDTSKLDDCFPINTSPLCEGVDKVFYRGSEEMSLEITHYQYGDDDRYYYQGDLNQPLSDHSPLFVTINYDFKRK